MADFGHNVSIHTGQYTPYTFYVCLTLYHCEYIECVRENVRVCVCGERISEKEAKRTASSDEGENLEWSRKAAYQ